MGKLAASFAIRFPEVRLEVSSEDRPIDMIKEGIDLVIRVNPDPDDRSQRSGDRVRIYPFSKIRAHTAAVG